MSTIFQIKEHNIPGAHVREYARAISSSQNDTLMLHIRQYTPKDNLSPCQGDITVIGAHGSGFPKEIYEPLWDDLYHETLHRGLKIRDIWIADCAWEGKSGILNDGKLGNDPGWLDYARDIVHMINTFRMSRPIIGVGHSFGGNAIVNASLMHPRLFTTLILYDPVINQVSPSIDTNIMEIPRRVLHRQDVWPNRAAAYAALGSNPVYKSWDTRVFHKFIEHGLRELPGKCNALPVTLTTTKHQDIFTTIRPSWEA